MTPPSQATPVTSTIESGPMGRRQWAIVTIAFLTMIAEGLDITIASHVYPHIIREWDSPMSAITFAVTAGVIAMAIGGVAAGPVADRWGRKGVLVVGVLVFGLGTMAMGMADTVEAVVGLRVLACVGLGAVMPVAMTVVADWTPAGRRSQMITLSFSGVALGSIIGGYLAAGLIPAFGWQVVLLIAGAAALPLLPLILFMVPESPKVLLARGRSAEEVRELVRTVTSGKGHDDLATGPGGHRAAEEPGRTAGFRTVLSRSLMASTALIWTAYFIGLGVLFLILNYLPLILSNAGFPTGQTGVIVATFGWGGLVGQIATSFLLRRLDGFYVVAALWALGLVGLVVVANVTFGFAGFLVAAFAIGLMLPSVNAALNALVALTYPQTARATGLGAASAVGRVGTLASGFIGGSMIAAGWSISMIFLALTLPIAFGIIAVLGLRAETHHRARRTHEAVPEAEFSPRSG